MPSSSVPFCNNRSSDRSGGLNRSGGNIDSGSRCCSENGTETLAADAATQTTTSTGTVASSVKIWVSALEEDEMTDSSPDIEVYLSTTTTTATATSVSVGAEAATALLPPELKEINGNSNANGNDNGNGSSRNTNESPDRFVFESILPPVTDELRAEYALYLRAKQALPPRDDNENDDDHDGKSSAPRRVQRQSESDSSRGKEGRNTTRGICCCLFCGVPALLWLCLIGFATVTVVYAVITALGVQNDTELIRPPYGSTSTATAPLAVPTLAPTVPPASR